MENKKLGQEPAFPNTDCETFSNDGMSKRFYAACAAMQGLISNPYWASVNPLGIDTPELVKKSLEVADELLKQEFDDEN